MVTQLPADEETTAQNGHRPWEWAAPCTLEKEGAKSVTARYLQSQKQTGCIPWRRNVISHREPMLKYHPGSSFQGMGKCKYCALIFS